MNILVSTEHTLESTVPMGKFRSSEVLVEEIPSFANPLNEPPRLSDQERGMNAYRGRSPTGESGERVG